MTYSHGGEIYDKNIRLDFSVSLNPLGCPESVKKALGECCPELNLYPDINYNDLRRALALYENTRYHKSSCISKASQHTEIENANEVRCMEALQESYEDTIIPLSGASEGITAVAGMFSGKKVLLRLPIFGGYERAFANAKCDIYYSYPNTLILDDALDKIADTSSIEKFSVDDYHRGNELLIKQIEEIKPDLMVIGSPSNPLGQLIDPGDLKSIVNACKEAGTTLLCDEAFMGFVQGRKEYSLIRFFLEYSRLIIIRSFTKLYSCPGLRLGYAVTSDPLLAESIREHLPEWNISLPAEKAMLALCEEGDFADKIAEYVAVERKRMLKEMSDMQKSGESIFPFVSDANYIFFKSKEYIYEKLLENGILIRNCDNYRGINGKGFYRIGLKTREENDELLDEMKKLMRS